MNEHLFLGDSTYPHTPITEKMVPSASAGEVAMLSNYMHQRLIDRIEQLERELEESKKRASCGYELTLQLLKITPLYLKKGDFIDRPSMVDCIVEWRKQIDKIDAAIHEGKA